MAPSKEKTPQLTVEQIRNGNKVLGNFDGWITPPDVNPDLGKKGNRLTSYENLKYHTSYDWLMPVWVRFRDNRFGDMAKTAQHKTLCDSMINIIAFSNEPMTLFKAMVHAIKTMNNL